MRAPRGTSEQQRQEQQDGSDGRSQLRLERLLPLALLNLVHRLQRDGGSAAAKVVLGLTC